MPLTDHAESSGVKCRLGGTTFEFASSITAVFTIFDSVFWFRALREACTGVLALCLFKFFAIHGLPISHRVCSS